MSLNRLIEEHVSTVFLNTEHFAESVCFHCQHSTISLNGIVTIDEPVRDDSGEEMTTYTGQVEIAEVDVSKLSYGGQFPLTATIKGNLWHLSDSGDSVHGMRTIGIRRQERRLSNAVTLDGKQKRYGRLSPNP
jgi:hypothetical protein